MLMRSFSANYLVDLAVVDTLSTLLLQLSFSCSGHRVPLLPLLNNFAL